MHANPSTAQPCALDNTSKKARLIQEINDAPASALPTINAILESIALHDTNAAEAIVENPETSQEERELLNTLIAKTKAEIEQARFQPVFTKKQVSEFEAHIQEQRNIRRRVMLLVLCLSEKHLQYMAANQQEEFLLLLEQCTECLDESKAQLDLATAAHSRLLLVGGEA